ncbi:hypothetical protein Tco_1200106, partial [Tanacetum coccineum]
METIIEMEMEVTIQEVAVEGRCTLLFEKMESVIHISNYAIECQVKYATCTLLGGALKWWNSHVRTIGHDAAYEISVPDEEDKVERFIWGIHDSIQGNVTSSKPTRLQEAIQIANSLMYQKNVARAYTTGPREKKEYAGTLPL